MRNLIGALTLCAAVFPAAAQDASGARDASRRFIAALTSGDAAAAAGFFAEDGVALPPGRPALATRADIQRFLGNFARTVTDLKYVSEDQKAFGDGTVREVGTFSFTPHRQGASDVAGKYLLIWTRVGGDWKIAADMWNRSGGPQGGGRGRPGAAQGGRGGMGGGRAGGGAMGGGAMGGGGDGDE